jgi:hypothetical protein
MASLIIQFFEGISIFSRKNKLFFLENENTLEKWVPRLAGEILNGFKSWWAKIT